MLPISFEFYPPKTDEQRAQLDRAAAKLKAYAPEYVSCTFGAGGSTLSYTSETVRHLNQHHGFEAAPHLSCVGGNREEIRELLKLYRAIGCRRIVALRGDLPSGMGHPGDLRYASELIVRLLDTGIMRKIGASQRRMAQLPDGAEKIELLGQITKLEMLRKDLQSRVFGNDVA